jgi:hypothetical protein
MGLFMTNQNTQETSEIENKEQNTVEVKAESAENNLPADNVAETKTDDAQDDDVLVFGEDKEDADGDKPEEESATIKEIRAAHRRAEAERKRLKRELDELRGVKAPKDDNSQDIKEPRLWDDGIDGDEELLILKMRDYIKHKDKQEQKEREVRQAAEQEQQQVRETIQKYRASYDAIIARKPDAENAEATLANVLTAEQQAVIFEAAETPEMAAQLVYQLGVGLLNGNKEAEAIVENKKNLGKFAKSIGQLEMKLMNATRKSKIPAPDKPLTDTGVAKSVDATLAELEKKAKSTRDYTEYFAYMNKIGKKNE